MDKLTEVDILDAAFDAGFMISTAYGQDSKKLMPVTDMATLIDFCDKITCKLRKSS